MRITYVFILVALMLPAATAASVEIAYEIHDSLVDVTYSFSEVSEPFFVQLPSDHPQENLSVNESREFRFSSQNYLSGDILESKQFRTDLSTMPADISSVRIYLPESAVLTQSLQTSNPSATPRPQDAFSDGTRVILLYTQEDIEPARAIFVEYEKPMTVKWWYVLILLLAGGTLYWYASRSPKTQTDYTRNLFEDEKLLVEILLEHPEKEMWQNTLTKESGLSKVKVSRKISNLEKKGIIKKIPHGNTNKIRLVEEL